MDHEQFLSLTLDIGEVLLRAGAEISRVEDTIRRICRAYGYQKISVFTITSNIEVTMHSPEGDIITQIRRIHVIQNDMQKVEKANALSRHLCQEVPDLTKMKQMVDALHQTTFYSKLTLFAATILMAAAFAILFGGDLMDALASGLAGMGVWFLSEVGSQIRLNSLLTTFLSSFGGGILVVLLFLLGIGHNIDMVMIGDVMILIPGLAFTVSLRDLFTGDTISGLLGVTMALLKAFVIAGGFALALFVMGGL